MDISIYFFAPSIHKYKRRKFKHAPKKKVNENEKKEKKNSN